MSGAESSYAKFSNSPLVRGSNSTFEPSLFSKVGGIRGCTGATSNVAAANSDAGYNYKLVGGSKSNYVLNKNLPNLQLHKGGKRKHKKHHKKSSRHKRSRHRRRSTHKRRRRVRKGGNPFAVPSGYAKGVPSFGYEGADLSTTSKLAPGHAPITVSKNTSCKGGSPQKTESPMADMVRKGAIASHERKRTARFDPLANRRAQQERMRQQANDSKSAKLFGGKKRRRTYKKRMAKKYTAKNFKKHYMWNKKGKRYTAKTYKQHMRGVKLGHTHHKPKKNSKKRSKKRSRRHRMKGGYSQFLSNVPYSASYSTGGVISPSDLALANPVPHQRFVNCPQK